MREDFSLSSCGLSVRVACVNNECDVTVGIKNI